MPDAPQQPAADPDRPNLDLAGVAPATVAVVAGRPPRVPDAPLNPPVTFASTYHAGGDVEYGRYGNPTWTALETAVGALEGGSVLSYASGLAAVAAVLEVLLPDGGAVVAPRSAYTGTRAQLTALEATGRVQVRPVDPADTAEVMAALDGATVVWLESPTNPLLDVADVTTVAAAAHAVGAALVVDSTFATPLLRRPMDDGADLVVHSGTKLIAGHSDVLLGLVATRDATVLARLDDQRRLKGAVPGPMEAWLALRGLRTLALRVERGQHNATTLARRLREHPRVDRVRYPGFGAMVAIEVSGGGAAADAVATAVRLWVHATSLGGVESTLERRRRWESEAAEVPESLLRLSCGIEDVDDLWTDLSRALDAAAG
jgi:cystathionine gamma-synthase